MDDDIENAWAGETDLLSRDVRRDALRLEELLCEDFVEIGQSGRRWTRAQIIDDLARETGPLTANLSEQEAVVVGPGIVRLTYVLNYGGSLSRRSSWWRREGATMRCFFHQGTPVSSTDR